MKYKQDNIINCWSNSKLYIPLWLHEFFILNHTFHRIAYYIVIMQFVKFFIKIDIIDKAIAVLKFLDLYTLRAELFLQLIWVQEFNSFELKKIGN